MDKLEPRHSIPTALQILLSELDFLGQIRRNKKPCITGRVLVDSESYSGAVYRFLKGENRNNIISKVEQIFTQTVDAVEMHKNTEHIKIIINYAAAARNGVASLLETYSNDPDFKSKLKVQIDNIDLQLERFRHLIKGYATEVDVKQENEVENKEVVIEENKEEKHKEDEDFPGLNTLDLFDSSEIDKKRIRKNRIKKSLEKEA